MKNINGEEIQEQLIKKKICKYCQSEINSKAKVCPVCKKTLEFSVLRVLIGIIIGLGLIILFFWIISQIEYTIVIG